MSDASKSGLRARLGAMSVPDALSMPVYDISKSTLLRRILAGDTLPLAAMTLGDLLYDVARIDPTVMEAADFSRAEEIGDLVGFALFADCASQATASSLAGNLANLQGYVAERLVAQQLQSQGVEVSFPSTANNPGYDLLVNGEPFQVKCLADVSGVREHMSAYPDIPILVNEDLAPALAGESGVYPVPGLIHADVVDITRETVEAGAALGTLEIPAISLALASGRVCFALYRGQTDLSSALRAMSVELLTRNAAGLVGANAATLALLIAGVGAGWPIILAPLAGGTVGIKIGGHIAQAWNRHRCSSCNDAAVDAVRSYARSAAHVVTRLLRLAAMKEAHLDTSVDNDSGRITVLRYLKRRFMLDRGSREAIRDALSAIAVDEWQGDPRQKAVRVISLAKAAGVHPHDVAKPTKHLMHTIEQLDQCLARNLV